MTATPSRNSAARHSSPRLLAALLAMILAACSSAPKEKPTAGDCVVFRLWSNGFHTNLAFDAVVLEAHHPLRRLYPDADYFLVGWGERDFYRAENPGLWLGVKAIVPPSASAMQVIADETPVELGVWQGADLVPFAVTEAGARRLSAALARAIVAEDTGEPLKLGAGRVVGKSVFLAARGNFHLFNMCNHWTARRLREAGVPVRASISFTASGLMKAVRRKTVRACPAA